MEQNPHRLHLGPHAQALVESLLAAAPASAAAAPATAAAPTAAVSASQAKVAAESDIPPQLKEDCDKWKKVGDDCSKRDMEVEEVWKPLQKMLSGAEEVGAAHAGVVPRSGGSGLAWL